MMIETVSSSTTFQGAGFNIGQSSLGGTVKTDTLVPAELLRALFAKTKRDTVNEGLRDPDFSISFDSFQLSFGFEVVDLRWALDSSEIVLVLNHAGLILVSATLIGYWSKNEVPTFHLNEVSLNLVEKPNQPLSVFVASTLWAILGLGLPVGIDIPLLEYHLSTSFEIPVGQVQTLLEERHLAERLLVISSVSGAMFLIPTGYIDAADVESIAFCYHAIVDREFDWRANTLTLFIPPRSEYSSMLPDTDRKFDLKYPSTHERRTIFGQALNLGQFWVEAKAARVVNYESVMRQMQLQRAEPVEVVIEPDDAKLRFKAIDTPRFNASRFPEELNTLRGVSEKIQDILLTKYFRLFSATVDGLNSDQIEAITRRPSRIDPHK